MRRALGFTLLLFSITAAAQSFTARFETSECPLFAQRLAKEKAAEISCGYLIVPEDRQAGGDDRQVELFIFRIAASQPASNAPLVILTGGPGFPAAARIPAILESQAHLRYEVLAIDQRGAGFSRPSLNCPEADDPKRDSKAGWIRDCYLRLVGEGVGLRGYNSANSAKDIHDLLAALNIDEANIYGESYGSRLALTLARDFPQHVRALILDGVLPLHVKRLEAHAPNGYRAITELFADCSADADCNRAYPNLRASFYSALRRMNHEPVDIQKTDMDHPIATTGDDFASEIYGWLYDKQLIPFLPAQIDAYARGDTDFDAAEEARRRESQALIGAALPGDMDQSSEGLALSVLCAEETPFNSRDEIVNQAAELPGVLRRPLVDMAIRDLANCEDWEAPPAAEMENQPVASDIPTLLLSGRYDPVTPPAWGEEAAKYLANSWHYVFPDAGHGVLFEADAACAESIALSFLADPQRQPADACMEALSPPRFYIRR